MMIYDIIVPDFSDRVSAHSVFCWQIVSATYTCPKSATEL